MLLLANQFGSSMGCMAATDSAHTRAVYQWLDDAIDLENPTELQERLWDLNGAVTLAGEDGWAYVLDNDIEMVKQSDDPDEQQDIAWDSLQSFSEDGLAVKSLASHLEAYAALGLPKVQTTQRMNYITLHENIRLLRAAVTPERVDEPIQTSEPRSYFRLARLEAQVGNYESAIANFVRGSLLAINFEVAPQPHETTWIGIVLRELGLYDDAENFLGWSMWQKPDTRVWAELSILWQRKGELSRAARAWAQSQRTNS